MNDRIYVCHTYYHTYISFLKELKLIEEAKQKGTNAGEATLVLSKMSNNFEKLGERILSTGVFAHVIDFDEKPESFFPELSKYKKSGNFVGNLYRRMRLCSKFAKLEEKYIPVNFKDYKEIYVYCDADPIGNYLNKKRIRYHGVEDGLDCIKNFDAARYDNRGHFGVKAFLSMRLNLITMQNGWGKYCVDMEVNNISAIQYPCPRYIEYPRKLLIERLTRAEKDLILKAYVRDLDGLKEQLANLNGEDAILILTDPLCELDVREKIFKDIIKMYRPEGKIFLKPHPRDVLDYRTLFSDIPQFDATMPMEMLGFFDGLCFKKVVGVLTEMKGVSFAREAVRLGPDFMDKYEAPEIHRQNEHIF